MPGKRGNPNLVKGGPSLNPKGRPKGAPKRTRTQMQNALIDSFSGKMEREFEDILEAIIKEAIAGNMAAAKILLDRAIPARKSVEHLGVQDSAQGITINITPLEEGQNPLKIVQDVPVEAIEGDYEEVKLT